ncbi:FAD/NAD(P)-binding protein [Stenoxybacter acetivorans]|uniref:FAD/NAD(P)-binding protein n=1 Tax=Stenoxybacter acetivorans TaxID=422441 RepID=UPI00068AD08D|nr:FAD/NAD(P)-binding protein [Stenoxybacter acetivorans]
MDITTIGIVGMGPRGLNLLERIISAVNSELNTKVNLLIFEPCLPGSGCHNIKQPDYLLANTIAGQITMFADRSVKNIENMIEGPTFYQWLCDKSLSIPDLSPVDSDAYYSRQLLGEYLSI